jgi:hypothetical protein
MFAAVATLAQNLEALVGSISEANANFRNRLSLDAPDPTPALEHDPAAGDRGGTSGAGRPRKRAA